MLACRNKRRLGILIDAMICRHTEILLMPWYTGILKFCSCHDMSAYWHLTLAMICQHTDILLLPWYASILKLFSCHDILAYWNTCNSRYHLVTWYANKLIYLRPETWDIKYAGMNTKYAGRVIKHAGQDIKYAGRVIKHASQDITYAGRDTKMEHMPAYWNLALCPDMPAYWNTWDFEI
jgi:hypothetical protein